MSARRHGQANAVALLLGMLLVGLMAGVILWVAVGGTPR